VLNSICSGHLSNELVDELLSVTVGTVSLTERVSLDLESTEWGGELEWPEEVVGFLELWSAGDDLVDEVLDELIPCSPSSPAMMLLSVSGILDLLTLP